MRRLLFVFTLFLIPNSLFAFSVSAATPSPDLVILSPTKGQILPGHELTVKFLAPNVDLPKFGHIHLWLDQTQFTKTSAIKAYSTSYDLTNLKYGYHTLTAELVNPDHSSFAPPLTTAVTFKLVPASLLTPSAPPPALSPLHLVAVTIILLAAAFYLVSKQRESLKKPVKHKSKRH